ncbi:MAG TPA: FAD-dependent oxidoreductase [Steroidobacteraceae bacterium]|nr:FAD-dependent oxidoreductase [Steroidobacteraceae bacterium]
MQNQPTPGSYWRASVQLPEFAPLAADLTVDVCVIGAGIAGLTSAYLLSKQGLSVVLIEALGIGSGETGQTTAHIAVPDDRYWHIEKTLGARAARQVAESFGAAADLIEATTRDEAIDCDFERVSGYLYSCAKDPAEELCKELEAAERAGVRVSWQDRLPISTVASGPCLKFADQAQFHSLRYLVGLTHACTQRRTSIYCDTRALDIEEREYGVVIKTLHGKISAAAAVVATNVPFNDRVTLHAKQFAYQTYAVAAPVERGSLPHVLIWDDGDPYHYVRLAALDDEHDLLIVGGADHRTGQNDDPEECHRQVHAWLRDRFPMAGPLAYRWSGEVAEPLDGIAYLGRNPGSRNVYVITGDSGNGISHATVGAMLVSDQIMQRPNAWESVYDPSRKPVREALHFMREQANVAAQYGDWVAGGESTPAAIGAGEGAVIRHGLRKLAVFRDEDGALHCHSATCPHLGCVVRWNPLDRTWDCPCHGSRFSTYGSVLHGPAVSGLASIDEEDWLRIVEAQRESKGAATKQPHGKSR